MGLFDVDIIEPPKRKRSKKKPEARARAGPRGGTKANAPIKPRSVRESVLGVADDVTQGTRKAAERTTRPGRSKPTPTKPTPNRSGSKVPARAQAGPKGARAKAKARVRPPTTAELLTALQRQGRWGSVPIPSTTPLRWLARNTPQGQLAGELDVAVPELADAVARALRFSSGVRPTRPRVGPPAPGRSSPGPFPYASERSLITGATAPPTVTGTSSYGRVPRALGRALREDPVGTTANTGKGLANMLIGSAAMLAEVPINTVIGAKEGDPLRGVRPLKDLPDAAWEDLKRRYGGSEEEMAERLKEEGAAAELVDFLTVAAPAGAAVGRPLGAAARAGKLGAKARRIATERPALKVSGGKTEPQQVGRNYFRAYAQSKEDALRRRVAARRGGKALVAREDEVAPIFQGRAIRRADADLKSRAYVAQRQAQTREIDAGSRREFRKLSRFERRGWWHATQGIVTADNPKVAVRQLKARKARVLAEVKRRVDAGELPAESRLRELEAIDWLIANAGRVFTPRLLAFAEAQAARGARIEKGERYVRPETLEARRLRPQGEELGVAYPIEVRRRAIAEEADVARKAAKGDRNVIAKVDRAERAALRQLEEDAPRLKREYAAQVREVRGRRGEPAYVQHQPRDRPGRAERATGGSRPSPKVYESDMSLYRTGRANVKPDVLFQSQAQSIKRTINYPLVADRAEMHAHRFTPEEVKRALGREADPDRLSIEELRRVMESERFDPEAWGFWSPGIFRVRREGQDPDRIARDDSPDLPPQELEGMAQAAIKPSLEEARRDSEFAMSRGVKLIPREAADEILNSFSAGGPLGRSWDKLQGFTARQILGWNPTWPMMGAASNAMLSVLETKGNPAAYLTAKGYLSKNLSQRERDALNQVLGVAPMEAMGARQFMGAAGEGRLLYDALRAFEKSAVARGSAAANVGPRAVFAADAMQNSYFREVIAVNAAKRQAFMEMADAMPGLLKPAKRVLNHLVRRGEAKERMRALLSDQASVEQIGRTVDDLLGNWTRYTAQERKSLKRIPLFYGYLRFATRLAFFTLPVKHPVATAITLKLAQLHNAEIEEIVGGPQAPWAYGRIFLRDEKGKLKRAPNGEPLSIDLTRMNPVSTPFVEAAEDPSSLLSLSSPALQIIFDQGYGTTGFTKLGFRTGGDPNENKNPSLGDRGRIALNDVLSLNWLYRQGVAARSPRTQGDDSLLWDMRPLDYKPGGEGEANEAKRIARREATSPWQQVLPLFVGKPDNTADIVKQRQREAAQRRGGGAGSPAEKILGRHGLTPEAASPEDILRKYDLAK